MSVNKCIFIGRIGKDPEIKFLNGGNSVCNFSIACTEKWVKDGEKMEKTEWVNVVAFKKLAEICGEYLKKGKQVYIEGKMQTRTWDDKDGKKCYMTEVVANQMQMLGSRDGSAPKDAPEEPDDEKDTVPF